MQHRSKLSPSGGFLVRILVLVGAWEHPGAELGRFFASLAVVGTWGDQPPSGAVRR
jgi:hypothetical protein